MAFKRANASFFSLCVQTPFSTPVAHAVLTYALQMHSKVGSFGSRFPVKALIPMTGGSPAFSMMQL